MFLKLLGVLGLTLVIIGGVFWWQQEPKRIPLSMPDTLPETLKPAATPDTTFSLLVTGDVLTARTVNQKNVQKQDFTWPWQKTAEVLRAADLTFINLETPLTSDCQPRLGGMIFCGSLRNVEGLTYAGVDIVNLANNHMGNQGLAGVQETVTALEAAGLKTVGVDDLTLVTIKDTKLAFLGYNEVDQQVGIQLADTELIQQQVAAAKAEADIVIVQFHWGAEYQYQPTTNQKRLAHLAVDAGADLVIGNHPHWWQPTEEYRGKLITYSHGNFIFDQMWSQETREGLVGTYTFSDKKLVDAQFEPVIIEDYGQPRWATEDEKQKLLERFDQEKRKLQMSY